MISAIKRSNKGRNIVVCMVLAQAVLFVDWSGFTISAQPALPKVLIIGTGGTIAEKIDPQTHAAVPAVSTEDLIAAVPELKRLATIETEQLMNIDSSQATPGDWLKLARRVREAQRDPSVTGIVITHGTDTMEEAVFFVDRTLESDKPVVFVGAQRNASAPDSDGPGNIRDAVTLAVSPLAKGIGATIVMNGYITPAVGARKTETINVQTFMGGDGGFLGYVGQGQVRMLRKPLRKPPLPLPDKLPNVAFVSVYSGSDGSFLKKALEDGAEGLVVEGVGAGNVNKANYEVIKQALKKNIPVVITSRVYFGSVFPIYGGDGGGKTLSDDGCILANDMTSPQARLMLILALAQTKDPAKLKEHFR
ncbi:MAG TPA: asparaginase [Candidatus Angelobacter sp.]|nr:asparaginase [Candidatus Angelobacter sp.]